MPDTQHAAPKTGITEEGYLTDSWYLAAPSTDLAPGKQHRIMVLGEPVVVGHVTLGGHDDCELVMQLGKSLYAAGYGNYRRAFLGKSFGSRLANSGTGAGHNRHAIF